MYECLGSLVCNDDCSSLNDPTITTYTCSPKVDGVTRTSGAPYEYYRTTPEGFMSLRVIPNCIESIDNNIVQHVDAITEITYVVGTGTLSIPYPPETYYNTWNWACGDITTTLIDYDRTLVTLYDTRIEIEASSAWHIGKTSNLVFESWLVWDDT